MGAAGCGFIAGALLLALAPRAWCDAGEVDAGVRAYRAFDYDRARRLFGELAERRAESAQIRATAFVYLGLISFTKGERSRADTEFAHALELAPDIEVPEDASPKIIAHFKALKRRLAATQPGAGPATSGQTVVAPPPPVLDPGVAVGLEQAAPSRKARWLAGGLGVAGAVLLAGGGVARALAASKVEAFVATRWADDAQALGEDVEAYNRAGDGLFVAGGVALTAGVTWLLVDLLLASGD